jgi:hypothetical protein
MPLLPSWMLLKSDAREKFCLSSKHSIGRSFLTYIPKLLTAQLNLTRVALNIATTVYFHHQTKNQDPRGNQKPTMPEYRGIHIALVSQYDAMLIPEHHPPNEKDDDAERQIGMRTVNAYISNYSASQFWIRYACDMSTKEPETRFFYFKLYIAGTFSVAWGCGAQDEWEGKTLFVPKDVGREKLGLFFPHDVKGTSQTPALEIQVYRAKARRRQERQYAPTVEVQGRDGAVQ